MIQPQKLFSHPAISVIIFMVAAAALNTWQIVLPNFHFDNSFSVAAAKNIVDGNGYVTKQVLPADLANMFYEPINKWPPGYSWLLAAIMKLGSIDAITAVYIVNAIVILFFLAGIYYTLAALQFPVLAINGFILFAGFFPYPFLGPWFADLAAVSFFSLAIGLIMQAHSSGKYLLRRSIMAALLCSYCIFLKYLYLPVAILPLIVWGWYLLKRQKREQFRAAFAGAVIVMTAALLLLFYQSFHSGQPVYVNPTGKGFFPEHVLEVGALIPASLIDQEFLLVQLSRWLPLSYREAALLIRIVNYILMAGAFYWIYQWWRKTGELNLYARIALTIAAVTAGLLLFLSLTFGPYLSEFTPFWTYVEELRYYAIVLVFIQQWIFWYFIVHQPVRRNLLYKLFRAAVIIIVSIGILHSAYYLVKQAAVKQQTAANKENEQIDIKALQIVQQVQKQYPDLIICSNNHELANISSLSGAPVLYNFEALNGELRSSKPVVLLAIIRDDFTHRFTPFFRKYKPAKLAHSYNFSFYLAAIP